MRNPTFFKAVLLLLIAITSARVNAQNAETETPSPSPSPSPESEEVLKRREAKTIAELERDIAKAKKEKLDAEFPKPTATPLEGKTELDSGVKLESEMLAYGTMSNAAAQIVSKIKNDNITPITALAIHNDRDLKALMGYLVISSQIDLMKQEYANSITPGAAVGAQKLGQAKIGPAAALPIAQSFLGSFIDLIALLRTDTSIKGMDFNIEESALVSEVFREIRTTGGWANIKLFYPAVFPPHITEDRPFFILARIQELYEFRERAGKLITEIAETEKTIDDTKAEIKGAEKKLKDDKDKVALLDKELERLQKIYWRWPSSRIAERIEEVTGQITNLRDEIQKLPIAIKENKAKLGDLDQHLSELYGEILPLVDPNLTLNAIDNAISKIVAAQALLGRAFSTKELGLLLTEFDPATKKALIAIAEKKQGRKLTDAEKEQLLTPLSEPERNALHKIYTAQIAPGVAVTTATLIALTPTQKRSLLTQAERFALLSELEQTTLQDQKKEHLTQLRALNDQFDKLKDELIKVDSGAGINALTSYLQAENLMVALGCSSATDVAAANCPDAYILQVKVIRAGGNNKTTRNLLKDVFTGPSISHSGGTITQYNLYTVKGQSVSSEVFPVYSGYVNHKDIPRQRTN